MARVLRDLLDAREPLFSDALRQLEAISGRAGADIKLIGDITAKAHESMRILGLNPAAATGEELYEALMARVEHDARRLTQVIGASDPHEVRGLILPMLEAVRSVRFNRTVFVLKHEVAQNLLRRMPPTKLITHLGYKTVDELIEGEDFNELYTAIRFSEGPDWLNSFNVLFESVTPNDYEHRELQVFAMDHDKYVELAARYVAQRKHTVTYAKELGTVALMPIHSRKMKGSVLRTLPLLLHYMNELRVYSTFFKLKSSQANFGETVANTLIADPGTGSILAGKRIHWRVVQRYYGSTTPGSAEKRLFEPHIQSDDLHWNRAEDLLYQIDPELSFWKGRDHVGLNYEGYPVAFNLFDATKAYSEDAQYQERPVYHFRESLWNELFVRYMGSKTVATHVFSQLDAPTVAPEKIALPKKAPPASKLRKQQSNRNLLVRQRLIDSAEGRLETVVDEFEQVFDMLATFEKTVTIFGSARKPQDDAVTMGAYDMARRLADEGYAVVTGGGHGVMEAANRGAYEAGGTSVGLNILLPHEQTLNSYTTHNFQFMHFFGRKVAMTLDASAFIYFPGGFGTFDELFEILALQQTRKIDRTPVILVGSHFWRPFDTAIREVMLDTYQTIEYADTELYRIYDNYDDVISYIQENYRKRGR